MLMMHNAHSRRGRASRACYLSGRTWIGTALRHWRIDWPHWWPQVLVLACFFLMPAAGSANAATAAAANGAAVLARAHDDPLDDEARLQLLAAFEADLARVYAGLRAHAGARDGAPAAAKWLPGSDTGAAVHAAQQLREAVARLVGALHWPAPDAQQLALSMSVYSTPSAAMLTDAQIGRFAALYTGECQGLGDDLHLAGGATLPYFLAGLFRRTGADVEVGAENFAFGSVCMYLPIFTVHHHASNGVVAIDPQLRLWLREPMFAAQVAALYDTAITDVEVSVFDDTVIHAFSESAQRTLTFGRVDALRAEPHILLYSADARQFDGAQAAFRGVWFDSVRIHEMLHVLHRAPCPGIDLSRTIAWNGGTLGTRQLREAQAEIATIASYASADSDLLIFVLMRSYRLTQGRAYRLGDDLFFAPLLALTARRAGAPAALTHADRLDLFLKVNREDVLATAKSALTTVIAQQALLCAAR
jgi:hypothetical protein